MGKPAGGGWGWSPGISRLKSPLHRHERRGHGSRWAPTAGARRGRPLLPKATKLQTRIAIWLPRSAAWSECTRCWVCCEGHVIPLGSAHGPAAHPRGSRFVYQPRSTAWGGVPHVRSSVHGPKTMFSNAFTPCQNCFLGTAAFCAHGKSV
jgi:hypothetical protein